MIHLHEKNQERKRLNGLIAAAHLYGQAYRVASAGSGAAPMTPSM